MLRGRTEDALEADRNCARYRARDGRIPPPPRNLLYRLGRLDEAAEAFGRAAVLDPENPEAKRSLLTVYFDGGRFREALAIGGELIQAAPGQRGIR